MDEVLGDIDNRRWIWAPAFLIELAYVLHRFGRGDDFVRATAAAYATPWLESARAISGGDFVRAADVLAGIGSRPDEAYARLRAAEALLVEGRRAGADEQLAPALEFFRSVRATRYLAHAERLLASSAEPALGSFRPRADWRLKPEPRVSRPSVERRIVTLERNGCQPSTSVRQLACQERPCPAGVPHIWLGLPSCWAVRQVIAPVREHFSRLTLRRLDGMERSEQASSPTTPGGGDA